MTTPLDIITLALRDAGVCGIGQTPEAEDTNNAFTRLNWMIAQWARQRWLVYHLVTLGKTSTGAMSYTVGPGGDYDITERPDRLESAFVRQIVNAIPAANYIDYPLRILQSREDYNRITVKQLGPLPYVIFYDSAYPLGTIYPWPVAQASTYAVHITVKAVLGAFPTLTTEIELPPEYYAALYHNLVIRLYAAYRRQPDPIFVGLAKESLNVIRGANTQIAALQMPNTLRDGSTYNIYSDQGG